jgi:predicted phosphodiesterase
MSHYIFTDVHGCIEELRELYTLASPGINDTIVIAGDLLDRGPDSAAVVRFFRELSLQQPVVLVSGNHESKHKRYRKNRLVSPGVAQQMLKHNDELERITADLSPEDIEWLDAACLYYRIPGQSAVVLHGGVTPKMRSLGRSEADKWHKHEAHIMYVRKLETGEFWADVYDGRFGHIFFGHEPFIPNTSPVQFQHATGLDLGCVFGGSLACAVVADDGSCRYLTVKARAMYAQPKGE